MAGERTMRERKELEHFYIGNSYGGNQRWMRDWWMHLGGCAALTTCDFLIDCALHEGRRELYPYDAENLTKKDYRKFGMSMKPYLRPREGGIRSIDTYMDGVRIYLEDVDAAGISLRGLDGSASFAEARDGITAQIDDGLPVAYLMLKHRDKKFDFFEWHWFLVNGYERREDGFYIKAATYGAAHWLCLDELWETGFDEKGGLVFFEVERDRR